jgi:predicted CoA-binding protein
VKHLTRGEITIRRLLDRARTIAIIGASPRPERHSHVVTSYLHEVRYDVVPVRADGQDIDGFKSYERIEDIPGPIDLAIIYRRPEEVVLHIEEAARKGVEAVWLPPGVWSREAEEAAHRLGLFLIKDCCPEEEHRHMSHDGGHPQRAGMHFAGRHRASYEDNRKSPETTGYTAGGGGGHRGGGGVRAVLDEKKMESGRPSPRKGPYRERPY